MLGTEPGNIITIEEGSVDEARQAWQDMRVQWRAYLAEPTGTGVVGGVPLSGVPDRRRARMPERDETNEAKMGSVEEGGSVSHGPRVHSGGEQEPGGLVPPYEGRVEEGGSSNPWPGKGNDQDVAPGPGREISDVEREGVSATDMDAESRFGVGVSTTRRGEDVGKHEDEPGREDAGTKGASDRPYGTSDARDSTSVDPQDSTGGPTQPAGDQGG